MSNWEAKTLGQYLTLQRGYDLTADQRTDGDVPVMGAGGQNGTHGTSKASGPGVVIGRSGSSFGEVYLSEFDFWPHNTSMYVIDYKGNDIFFTYYMLKNLDFNRLNSGSAQPSLNRNYVYPVKVKVPKPDEQAKISNALRLLDKKIEINNRINAELEATAKTLYDYWFVQFDFPDANDKPYKTSGGKMVYNSTLKREIPDGWSDGTLGEIAELYQPKTISEKEMAEDGHYLVYGANGIVGRYHQYNHEQSVVAITCRGNSCGAINVTRSYSWITGNAMVVKPISFSMTPTYIYNLLRSSGLENVITGSAQPQITRTNLAPMKIIRPDENVLNKYAVFIKPNFEKRMTILEENEKLAKLRDWLLPMLMNGQVTVL